MAVIVNFHSGKTINQYIGPGNKQSASVKVLIHHLEVCELNMRDEQHFFQKILTHLMF